MLFGRIHSPMQQTQEKRRETPKRGEAGKDFPE
jgi:hypothetical protein